MKKKIFVAAVSVFLIAGIIIAVLISRNFAEKKIPVVKEKTDSAAEILISNAGKVDEVIEEANSLEITVKVTEEVTGIIEMMAETAKNAVEIISAESEPEETEREQEEEGNTQEVTEEAVQAPAEDVPEKNSEALNDGLPFDIASLATAARTNQIVMAVGDGSLTGATVYLFEKGEDSVWKMTLETPAYWGKNGISYNTIEGDKTTPAGSFDLGLAFGNYSNPGTALTWVDVNPYMYWVDDVNSDYYNLLIDSREVPEGWSSGEHLAEIMPDYAYAINIEVNPERRKDSTSAIFLHCGLGATGGCVAVPENCMVTILQRLKPGAKMIIAENASTVSLY